MLQKPGLQTGEIHRPDFIDNVSHSLHVPGSGNWLESHLNIQCQSPWIGQTDQNVSIITSRILKRSAGCWAVTVSRMLRRRRTTTILRPRSRWTEWRVVWGERRNRTDGIYFSEIDSKTLKTEVRLSTCHRPTRISTAPVSYDEISVT